MKTGAYFKAACLYSLIVVNVVCASQMTIASITSRDLSKERCLFKECWYSIYQDYSLRQLGFSNVSQVLQESFDQEERDYVTQAPNRLFFNAVVNDQVVGYVSFEIKDEAVVYIKQIAMLPYECTVDTLRELIFVIFDHVDKASCIHMDLHRMASQYGKISRELGFIAMPSADKALIVHLMMQCNKCGNCLCDLDYADQGVEAYSDPFWDGEGDPENDGSQDDFDEEEDMNRGGSNGNNDDSGTHSDK